MREPKSYRLFFAKNNKKYCMLVGMAVRMPKTMMQGLQSAVITIESTINVLYIFMQSLSCHILQRVELGMDEISYLVL